MYSKKEDFTNTIQFLIGERIESLEANSYSTIEELAKLFQDRNDKLKWKALSFLNIFYLIKSKVERLTSTENLKSSANINKLLSKSQKMELMAYLKENKIKPPELERPAPFENLIYLFPIPSILGTMLVCTYYITKHDYSGWIYLLGLIGLALSMLLLIGTAPLKNRFKEDNLVDYAKLTYTIKHKVYCQNPNTKEQLIQFLTDELEVAYGKRFLPTEMIPEN
jgi:hypothetical protein